MLPLCGIAALAFLGGRAVRWRGCHERILCKASRKALFTPGIAATPSSCRSSMPRGKAGDACLHFCACFSLWLRDQTIKQAIVYGEETP